MKHTLVRAGTFCLLVFCLVFTPSLTDVYAQPGSIQNDFYISAVHNNDTIGVHDFTPYAKLTFRIFDEENNLVYQVTMPTFGNIHYHLFQFQHDTDFSPGFRISVTDETSKEVKEVIVQNIYVTQFNPGESVIKGQSPAYAYVDGNVNHAGVDYPFDTTADQDGNWQYDFSTAVPGLLFDEDSSLYAGVTDADGDRSEYQIFTVRPGMEVFLPDAVMGLNFTPDEPVELEVYQGGSRIFGPWQMNAWNDGNIQFDLWKWGLRLEPGMSIAMHDLARDILKTIEVVLFTGAHDPVTNTLSGYAPPDRSFPLEICLVTLPCYHVNVTADSSGYWEYDLGSDELSGWTGFLYDDDGDALNPDNGKPSRHPLVFSDLNNNRIVAFRYPPDIQASLQVYPTVTSATPSISETVVLSQYGNYQLYTNAYGVDLLPDMRVDVVDATYDGKPRTMSMTLDFIAITDFITLTNTVQGLADPNTEVLVWGNDSTIGYFDQKTISDLDGSWQVIFDPGMLINSFGAVIEDTNGHRTGFEVYEGGFVHQVPPEGKTLTTTDDQGDQTQISIPPGAITETISLAFTPLTEVQAPAGFAFSGSAFELTAYQDGLLLPGFVFQSPVEITLQYSEQDIWNIDENSLTLDYWDAASATWVDAATTCTPASTYERHPEDNYLKVSICHLSRYGLFGEFDYRVFIPAVLRSP